MFCPCFGCRVSRLLLDYSTPPNQNVKKDPFFLMKDEKTGVSRPKLSIKKWKDFLTRKCELESRSEQEVLLECYTNRRRRRKSDYIAKLSMESRKLSKMGTQVERSLRCQTQLKGPLCFQLCNKSLNSSMLTAYRKHAVSMVLPRDNPLLKDATSS